jgi:hypothetical protein
MQAAMVNTTTTVCIDTPSTPSGTNRFHFHGGKPRFLPRSFTILMRPDGHIQWFDSP